ncbi:MAG TPA: energy transducer TonB [Blastocatellia bacterium]|jgi:TonB family protein|nr:energy transducer TonB [Blastocatellia bacterium]
MKNIGRKLISSVCALALVANSVAGVIGQDRKSDGKDVAALTVATIVDTVAITARRSDGGAPRAHESSDSAWQSADSAFQFFSQEKSFDDRLVTGAPFSADVVSETIQTLQDGTHIVQRFEGRIYRDSKGRTRSERTYQMGGASEQKQTINIYDPVDGASYRLDSDTRTGRKSVYPKLAPPPQPQTPVSSNASADAKDSRKGNAPRVTPAEALKKIQPSYPAIAKAANASGPVQVEILVNETGEVIDAYAVSGHPLLQEEAVKAARGWVFKPSEVSGRAIQTRGILTFNFELTDEAPAPAQPAKSGAKPTTKTESLGKQMVEGTECGGERAVTTMPVGTIGNDRPIETVNETWYSPELKIMILSKRRDPRFGESTYSVTNITRSEPYAELFLPPSDYKLIDGDSKKQITLDLKEIEEMRKRIEELQKRVEEKRKPDER